jgi:hypothetical protein
MPAVLRAGCDQDHNLKPDPEKAARKPPEIAKITTHFVA